MPACAAPGHIGPVPQTQFTRVELDQRARVKLDGAACAAVEVGHASSRAIALQCARAGVRDGVGEVVQVGRELHGRTAADVDALGAGVGAGKHQAPVLDIGLHRIVVGVAREGGGPRAALHHRAGGAATHSVGGHSQKLVVVTRVGQQGAGAGDPLAQSDAVAAVEDQRAVGDDHLTRAQGAGGAATANLQNTALHLRAAGIGVGPSEGLRARADLDEVLVHMAAAGVGVDDAA